MVSKDHILSVIGDTLDPARFREQHWEGSFWDYLELVTEKPRVARNAFQRAYDMILEHGIERYTWLKNDYVRYKFFEDQFNNGRDAIYTLHDLNNDGECDHYNSFNNDVLITDVWDSTDASGPIGIQHHGEKGQTYKFRNLGIRELE